MRNFLGGIYRSASGTKDDNLLHLVNFAMTLNCKYVLVLRDFNYPEIVWDTWNTNRNVNHDSFKFSECLLENYLYQLMDKPTHIREGQTHTILDLLLTNNEDWISSIEYFDQLGTSDHIQLIVNCDCKIQRTDSNTSKRQ